LPLDVAVAQHDCVSHQELIAVKSVEIVFSRCAS
jgi:hypothetical protein